MGTFKWIARQKGRIVADGSIEAPTERDAMQHALSSRQWKGQDFSIKVGAAQVSFDEEDVEKLAGEITNEHASDTPQKSIVQAAVDAMPNVRESLARRTGRPIATATEDSADGEVSVSFVPETTYGVKPGQDRFVIQGRPISELADLGISTTIETPCCHEPQEITVSPVHPATSMQCLCGGCKKLWRMEIVGAVMVHDSFHLQCTWTPIGTLAPAIDAIEHILNLTELP